jgi:ubiquinone/menaquinone biosynthesis C-methylase UbiE
LKTRNPFFGEVAANYDSWYATPKSKYAEEVEDRILFEALDGVSGSLLEVGSGTGNYLIKFTGFNFECGLDPSMDMLRESRKKADVQLVNGKAESLPFKDNSFDVVAAITSLEFFDDLEMGLKEMSRVTKRYLVLAFLSKPSLLYLVRRFQNMIRKNEFGSYNPLNSKTLAKHIVRKWSNFEIEFAKSTLFFFPIYHRKLHKFIRTLDLKLSKFSFGGYSILRLIKIQS